MEIEQVWIAGEPHPHVISLKYGSLTASPRSGLIGAGLLVLTGFLLGQVSCAAPSLDFGPWDRVLLLVGALSILAAMILLYKIRWEKQVVPLESVQQLVSAIQEVDGAVSKGFARRIRVKGGALTNGDVVSFLQEINLVLAEREAAKRKAMLRKLVASSSSDIQR